MDYVGHSMNYPMVSIIILNWNGWKDTITCLESLYLIGHPFFCWTTIPSWSQNFWMNSLGLPKQVKRLDLFSQSWSKRIQVKNNRQSWNWDIEIR